MWQALEHGLLVSKPFGDSAPYDVIVDNGRGGRCALWRVQVRSVSNLWWRAYRVHTMRRQGRSCIPLSNQDADFLAAFVSPCRVWYIIPIKALGRRVAIPVYPHQSGVRGPWECYREAWHLLAADAKWYPPPEPTPPSAGPTKP